MNLVKQCPACGHINPESEIFCANVNCAADISQVKAGRLPEPKPPSPPPPTTKKKVCQKCGAENEDYAIICGRDGCGEVIETRPVVEAAGPGLDVTLRESALQKLWLLVGPQSFECRSGDVLGRSGTIACNAFSGLQTVSGRHVSLELRVGVWHVVNLPLPHGRTAKNLTTLDNREIPIGQSLPLTGEHVLKMSTRCEVRLRIAP